MPHAAINGSRTYCQVHVDGLLVHGETDTVVPFDGARVLSRCLPHAELVAVPDTGHMILDRPEAMSAVRQFLRATTAQAAAEGAKSP